MDQSSLQVFVTMIGYAFSAYGPVEVGAYYSPVASKFVFGLGITVAGTRHAFAGVGDVQHKVAEEVLRQANGVIDESILTEA